MIKMGNKTLPQPMSKLKMEILEFRSSMNEWIMFLNEQQRDNKAQIRELERKVRELELEKELRYRRF